MGTKEEATRELNPELPLELARMGSKELAPDPMDEESACLAATAVSASKSPRNGVEEVEVNPSEILEMEAETETEAADGI